MLVRGSSESLLSENDGRMLIKRQTSRVEVGRDRENKYIQRETKLKGHTHIMDEHVVHQ